MKAVQFLKPTEKAQKSILKANQYKEKVEQRKLAQFKVTPENEAQIWHNLSQSIFSIGYAGFHTKKLQEKGAVPNDDAIVQYAELLEVKFESFRKSLPPEKREEYDTTRRIMEDFFFRVQYANADELDRTIKFLESIQNKRK